MQTTSELATPAEAVSPAELFQQCSGPFLIVRITVAQNHMQRGDDNGERAQGDHERS